MRFAVTIVRPDGYPHWQAFREVAETVSTGLTRLGHESLLTHETCLPGRQHIILGCNLLPGFPRAVAPDAVLYNLEQISPDSPWVNDRMLDLLRTHPVWDYSVNNIAELRRLGVERLCHVPIGHVPELERIPRAAAEDIDVLLIGSLNDRRMAPIRRLRALGFNAQAHFNVYGEQRDKLYARAKIVLNLHLCTAKIFEVVRSSYLLANRRFVISEPGTEPAEEARFAPGVVFADYADIVDVCRDFLTRDDDRRRYAQAGHEIMRARPAENYLRDAVAELGLEAWAPR